MPKIVSTRKQTKITDYWPISSIPAVAKDTDASSTIDIIEAVRLTIDFQTKDTDVLHEGRIMTLETNLFYLVNCYVPNAGTVYFATSLPPFLLNNYVQEKSCGDWIIVSRHGKYTAARCE